MNMLERYRDCAWHTDISIGIEFDRDQQNIRKPLN